MMAELLKNVSRILVVKVANFDYCDRNIIIATHSIYLRTYVHTYIFTRNFLFETIHKTAFGQEYLGSVSRVVLQSIIIIPAMRHS